LNPRRPETPDVAGLATGDARGRGRPLNRRLVLARRPSATLVADEDFVLEELAVAPLDDGEVLVRTELLSLDPSQRGWLDDTPSYVPPVALGETMRGMGAGVVIESRDPRMPVGTSVLGGLGWQELAVARPGAPPGPLALRAVPEGLTPQVALNVTGVTGLAAYFGLLEVGRPEAGDVVVVSGAAGATGATVGQLARIHGARAVGIAGGPEKCAKLVSDLGFAAAIDYRNEDVAERLAELAPDGIDIFYDNVGGAVLDAALANLAHGATVVIGGAIAVRYPADDRPPDGIRNLPQLMIRSARMEGFTLGGFAARFPIAYDRLAAWTREGRLRTVEDVHEGPLEAAPATLRRLFEGRNQGKQLLALTPPRPPR
jgi:NADPH-dependent curcumin reductase CurA